MVYTFIDLFAGAGGLSDGFIKEGYKPLAFVEMDSDACYTLKTRQAYFYLKKNDKQEIYNKYLRKEISREELYSKIPEKELNIVFNETIGEDNIKDLFQNIKNTDSYKKSKKVDLIIGGPPCQAYSLVGRARDPYKKEKDPKNFLYKLYVKFIEEFSPKMFVFENVPGILSAAKGQLFEDVKEYFDKAGYEIDYKILNSSDYGVLQQRKRVIIVGWQKKLNLNYPELQQIKNNWKVKDLLSDLPFLNAGENIETGKYKTKPTDYLEKTGLRTKDDILTDHITRPHNERDLEIYEKTINVWDKEKRRLIYTELPDSLRTHNNTKSFLDRFKVVAGNEKAAHTVVAHISKDGHYYIHPDVKQKRSLSVREAARLQSFPDNFYFEGSRTSKFKQIGNAVPVLLGEAFAKSIQKHLKKA